MQSTKGDITRNYGYDATDKLIWEELYLNNDYKEVFEGKKVYYDYNSKGDLYSIEYPDGSELNLNQDVYGRPTSLGKYANNIQYYPNGSWCNYSLSNGITAHTKQDNLSRIKQYTYGSISLDYEYDTNNNLLNLHARDTENNNYNYNLNFRYDSKGRIVKANGPWGKNRYIYDSFDNITKVTNYNGFKTHEDNFKYNNLRLTSAEYDSLGNITNDNHNKYFYGLDGNLLDAYGLTSNHYEYDANGHRILNTQNGISKNEDFITFYTKDGSALFEYDLNHDKGIKYVYLNGHKIAKDETTYLENSNDNKSEVYYYYNDAIGSPIAMADSRGHTLWHQLYMPFGEPYLEKNNAGENKHWFAGKELDNTNLSYFGARYFSSSNGRFTSPDPVAVIPEKTTTFNRYIYANNNPYKYVDPDGRTAKEWAGDLWSGMGVGSTFGAFGHEEYNYKSAYYIGIGVGAASLVTGEGEAIGAFKFGVKSTKKGGLNLFKFGHKTSKNISKFKKDGDRFLYLPNKGTAKLNWKQNSGYLRREMRSNEPIFDSYIDHTGSLIKDNYNSFINAERNLLESRGWVYNQSKGSWHPPSGY